MRIRAIKIPGLDFRYFATDCGRVYRYDGKQLRELKGYKHLSAPTKNGGKANGKYYWRVGLRANGKEQRHYKHRLILIAFVGIPKPGELAGHGEGGSLDNRLENLSWITHKQNQVDDRKRDGTYYHRRPKNIEEQTKEAGLEQRDDLPF